MSWNEKECLEIMKNLRSLVSNQSWLKHFKVINTLCVQTQHKTFFSLAENTCQILYLILCCSSKS